MKKSATLKDIAKATGVHVSTVSRVLAPNSQVSLSSEVEQRVRKTAEEMGYRPNRLASGLRTKRTMMVGVMIPDITNTLFPPIVRGVESVFEPLGYASLLVNTDSDPDREARLADVLLERGVDGIIDAAPRRIDPAIERISKEVPVVTANRQVEGSEIPSIVNDDDGGITMVLRRLYELGHRNIAHIAGPAGLSTGVARREAFIATTQDLGLKLKPSSVVVADRYDEDEGRRCAAELLDADPGITAIVSANDRLAVGTLNVLQWRGLDCPTDISLTGFNDIPFLDIIPPGLTTVRILQFEVGRMAAETLLKMIATPDINVPKKTILPVKLIERGSIAPPKNAAETRKKATR